MAPFLHSTAWLVALLFLLSCHDAPRTNPFDPALTLAVELQVALDDTAGTATLTWTRYEGQQPFREYRVLRNQIGLTRVDTLEHLTTVEQTTFVDTSLALDTDYEYWVAAVNTGGFAASSEKVRAQPLNLSAVELLEPTFDSRTAAAALRWTAYRGPRFKAYRLERYTAELAVQVVKEISDLADTTYVDSLLVGNTEYFYRVVVLTERGEELPSAEVSGKFHALLATWPLELEEPGYVRLYWEEDRLTALVTDPRGVRLRFYDPAGTLRQEQVLLGPYDQFLPRSVATALSPEGRRFLCATSGRLLFTASDSPLFSFGVVQFDAEGQPLPVETHLPPDDLPPQSEAFWALPGPLTLGSLSGAFDQVTVFRGDSLLFADDFSSGGKQWTSVNPAAVFDAGQLRGHNNNELEVLASTGEFSWQDFRVEAEVVLPEYGSGAVLFAVGKYPLPFAFVFLRLSIGNIYKGWAEQGGAFRVPFLGLAGIPHRLKLEVVDRRINASVISPVLWSEEKGQFADVRGYLGWGSLVLVEGVLGMTAGDQPYSVSQEGKGVPTSVFAEEVSETRTWKTGAEAPRLGICLPRINQILIHQGAIVRSTGAIAWPRLTDLVVVGTGAGQGAGELLFPLSLDGSPDGRIYVLDAGNGRIQVFDIEGKYLTQWGHEGSGEGEFDFGSGRAPEDFAGSVAVDSEGYIYVADVGNKRIQKFAP